MAWYSLTFMTTYAVLVTAQSSLQICGWQQARAGVVQDSLYIQGGLRSVGNWLNNKWDNVTVPATPQGSLYKLNFHQSWDVNQADLRSLFEQLNETLDGSAPVYVDGTMFADKDEFYTFGGQAYPTVMNTTIYEGVVHAGLHQPNPTATQYPYGILNTYQLPDGITKYITNGAGASVPSESLGFYFSGLRSSTNASLAMYGGGATHKPNTLATTMLMVDTSSFNNAHWSETALPSSITPRADASMVWVPVGSKGSLVVIGGTTYPSDIYSTLNTTQTNQNQNQAPLFMNNIPVYDIAGRTWYVQQTSGTSPPATAQACAVVASPSDRSSHQIYLYGGYDGSGTSSPYDTVWVLSLPAFQWTQVSIGSSGHARYAHVCATPYPNQMFAVGGQGLGTGNPITNKSIIDVFDLNTLQWTGKYDPSVWSQYKVPAAVASATQIPNNMDSGLASLMRTSYTGNITTYYPYTATTRSPKPRKWIVPVVASVVAVLAVAIIGITLWCLCRPAARKRRSEAASHSTHSRGIVARWLGTTQHTLPPKSQMSDNTTEIGDGLSPVAGAELYGGYFKPPAHAELDVPESPGSRYVSQPTSPAMSPMSHRSAEVEGSSPQSMTPNGFAIRNHHMYPHSIGGHLGSMRSTTVSSPETDFYRNARSPAQGPVQMSPYELPQNKSNEDLLPVPPADLDLNQSPKGSSGHNSSTLSAISPHSEHFESALVSPTTGFSPSTTVPPSAAVSPTHDGSEVHTPVALEATRPHHERNASSISSGISQMSPHGPGEEWRRSGGTDNSQERQGHTRVLSSIGSVIPRQTKSAYEENKHISQGDGEHGTI